jgi:hypothetical protein
MMKDLPPSGRHVNDERSIHGYPEPVLNPAGYGHALKKTRDPQTVVPTENKVLGRIPAYADAGKAFGICTKEPEEKEFLCQ